MLTLVTVNDPPWLALEPLRSDDGDVDEGDELLGEDDDGDDEELLLDDDEPMELPAMWPVTITWCPTCSARFTEESAMRWMSRLLREPLIDPAVRLLGSDALAPEEADDPDAPEPAAAPVEPEFEPAPEPEPVAPAPLELDPEPMLLLPPIFAFFRTKPPPAPLDGDALLVSLELLLSRCRQPVAVTCPAVSDERLVDWLLLEVGWLLCGLDVCGLDCGLDDWGV